MAFGQIFHQIIQSGFQKAHHPIEFSMIWKAMLIPSMGYIVGLILGFSCIVNQETTYNVMLMNVKQSLN